VHASGDDPDRDGVSSITVLDYRGMVLVSTGKKLVIGAYHHNCRLMGMLLTVHAHIPSF
jgi:hypothetical protein